MPTKVNTFEGKQCRIIEVAHSPSNRNVFLDYKKDLKNWIKNQLDIDLYSSFFRYYTDDPNVGGVLAGFGMDFDDAEKPKRTQKEALTVIKNLQDRFDIEEQDISVCFSGKKGFHVFVNHAVLGIEPHYYLPKIFKEMAKELIREHKLKTLDLSIYDRRRLIRLPNSRHDKTQLYKIPLTLSELENSSIEQITAMAVKQRPHVKASVEHKVSEKAHRWFVKHCNAYMKKLEDRKVEFAGGDLDVKEVLPCVKKRLKIGAKEKMRNRCTWQLASYFCKRGDSLEDCLTVMRQWHEKVSQGDHPYTWEECEKTIRKTYDVGGYPIGCGSEFTNGLCPGKEHCSLFVKKEETQFSEDILKKACELLEGDPLKYVADTVNKIHVGDRELIQIAYISGLSARLAKPIHLWPIGTSQKGKSHSLYTVRNVFPKEHYELLTSASPKSLFYYAKKYGESCFDGKLIYIDEIESSKLTLPLLRSLTSPTDMQPRHLSVYDADLLDLKIKGPRVIWFTSIKAFGGDQLRNRFIFVNPDETTDQDDEVFKLQLNEESSNPNDLKEFKTAQAITKQIFEETKALTVKIPYIDRIVWPYKNYRWLFPIFKSFIQIITKTRYKNREIENNTITSKTDDFTTAKSLWSNFIESIIYRASEPAKTLLNVLTADKYEAKTTAELAEEIGKSTRQVNRLLTELEDAQLINKRKRQAEGPGRLAWEYWRTTIPSTEDIKLNVGNLGHYGHAFSSEENKKNKNEASSKCVQNVPNSKNNIIDISINNIEDTPINNTKNSSSCVHEESQGNRKADSSSKPKTCGVESSSSHILHYVKRLVYMFLAQSSCGKLDI